MYAYTVKYFYAWKNPHSIFMSILERHVYYTATQHKVDSIFGCRISNYTNRVAN